jgi:hypothetical protein
MPDCMSNGITYELAAGDSPVHQASDVVILFVLVLLLTVPLLVIPVALLV